VNAHILVVDDETLIRQSLRGTLVREGYEVSVAASGAEAIEKFETVRPDAVLLDLVLGDVKGLDVLRRLGGEQSDTKFIVVTAQGSVEDAVAAMKLGAYDFIKKPFDLQEVLAAVRNALHASSLEHRAQYHGPRERAAVGAGELLFVSDAMRRVVSEADLIARNEVPIVLVLGESGTGKQLLARRLHDHSSVGGGPFVELNCSAIPDNLIESELFGHERGAFSDARERKLGLVEIADGGTLFLDEIGDLAQAVQAKLLAFLEQRTFRRLGGTSVRRVSARIVAATNRDLAAMAEAKTFRDDLWFRLGGMVLRLPPLRQRPDDIPPLVDVFLREGNRTFQRRWKGADVEALGILRRYRWPGNVRELRAVITRCALMNDDDKLKAIHLPSEIVSAALAEPETLSGDVGSAATTAVGIPSLAEVEAIHIRRVLALCSGNKTLAAQHLGITRQTLAKKLGAED
jgi:two-component system, NtrC family, response regulator AtoC